MRNASRQVEVVDEEAADDRAEESQRGRRRRPQPERPGRDPAPVNAAVMIASEPGTSERPGGALEEPRTRSCNSRVGASPHRTEITPNEVRPMTKIRRRP